MYRRNLRHSRVKNLYKFASPKMKWTRLIAFALCFSLAFLFVAYDATGFFYKGYTAYEKQDYKQAVHWYTKAAEQGHAKAQYFLGLMYGNGQGVLQSDKQTFHWYRKAAEQGHAKAQFQSGVMYAGGVPLAIR